MSLSKIDVHHHIIPPQLVDDHKGMQGWKSPEWTFEADTTFCNSIGVKTRIFSVSTPATLYIGNVHENARLAREMNECCATLCKKNPNTTGFFATIPPLGFTDAALAEIRYAMDELHADGVTLFTSYGEQDQGYLGNERFVPIWQELDARKAVVFVHPCDNGKGRALFNPKLPNPGFDWPHETGRTAMDMILNGRMRQFPNVKIILSHGGGTLPLLIQRSTLIALPEFGASMSADDLIEDGKRFYFDTALTGCQEVLGAIVKFAPPGHLLFGSDYPHATAGFSQRTTQFLDSFPLDEKRRHDINSDAAAVLFPRFG